MKRLKILKRIENKLQLLTAYIAYLNQMKNKGVISKQEHKERVEEIKKEFLKHLIEIEEMSG